MHSGCLRSGWPCRAVLCVAGLLLSHGAVPAQQPDGQSPTSVRIPKLRADDTKRSPVVIPRLEKAIGAATPKATEYDGTAVNLDFDGSYDHESYRMKSLSELQPLYKALPPTDRLITYCQTGARTAYTYLVLRALGYSNVAVYHDGWRVYGSSLKLPVDDETWFDFTKVNSVARAIKELQRKE
jgi:rhodanese-related sulfurtransferase